MLVDKQELEDQKQILTKLRRLQSVERRWLGSVIISSILSCFIVILLIGHLDIGRILSNQPTSIPATQFLLVMICAAIIALCSLTAFVDYFAFEVHVERQMIITKKRRQPLDEGEN